MTLLLRIEFLGTGRRGRGGKAGSIGRAISVISEFAGLS